MTSSFSLRSHSHLQGAVVSCVANPSHSHPDVCSSFGAHGRKPVASATPRFASCAASVCAGQCSAVDCFSASSGKSPFSHTMGANRGSREASRINVCSLAVVSIALGYPSDVFFSAVLAKSAA